MPPSMHGPRFDKGRKCCEESAANADLIDRGLETEGGVRRPMTIFAAWPTLVDLRQEESLMDCVQWIEGRR
jgi:hypothetical protein